MTLRTLLTQTVAILILAASNHTTAHAQSTPAQPLASTTHGKIRGSITEDIHVFKGIPYGASTAGANRFKPPQPPAPWSETRDALEYGDQCPQMPPTGGNESPDDTTPTSEDCLVLNVWTPGLRDGKRRPVMVWLHGGGYVSGSGASPLYDGTRLAKRGDVVIVTLNHRLNVFGHLYLGELGGAEYADSGNVGQLDIVLALQWVRDNIDRFGGDPNNVTIFGESAGAMSVGLHELSIPSSAGLFRAAIMQSNPFGVPYKSLAQARPIAALFKEKVGCANQGIECLQQVPVDTVLSVQADVELQLRSLLGASLAGFLVFAPVIDGSFVVGDPTVIADQSGVPLPTLLGTNEADGIIFVEEIASILGGTIDANAYRLIISVLFGTDRLDEIIALYGIDETGNNAPNLSRIATDYLFGCANRYVARRARSDIWTYRFDETSVNVWPEYPACENEACHADDVPFVFHVDRPLGFVFTPAQDALSQAMIGYWTAFAETFDPNGPGRPTWPRFTPNGLEYILLDTPISTAVNPTNNCDFWDEVGYEIDSPIGFLTSMAEAALSAAQ